VRYEELLEHPEEVLTKLCADIGLQFDTRMLNYHEQESELDRRHFLPSANATKTIDHSRVGRWRKELSREEGAYVAREGGGLLQELGYVHDHTWLDDISGTV
jgi:hypothetical protein